MHLNTGELVDIAEGTRPESAAPHLAACEACRAQVRDLRATLSVAAEVVVPEPSPLFWDHLSSRVSAAVAEGAADAPRRPWRSFVFGMGGAAAALVLAVALTSRAPAPVVATPPAIVLAEAELELLPDVTPDDASLTVVASLTDGVDLETAREAGLAPRGSAEHAVTHLSDGELRELGRLLQEELARPGA